MPEPRPVEEWAEEALKGAMIPGGIGIVNEYHARVSRAIKDYAAQQTAVLKQDMPALVAVAKAGAEVEDMLIAPQLLGFSAQKVANAAIERFRSALAHPAVQRVVKEQ